MKLKISSYNQSWRGIQPSEQVRSMGSPILEGPAGWKKDEYAPLRHMIAERKSKKLNLHLSQNRVRLQGCCCFSAMREAILLYILFPLILYILLPFFEFGAPHRCPTSFLTRNTCFLFLLYIGFVSIVNILTQHWCAWEHSACIYVHEYPQD